ncbi:hypothetical protein CS8_026200 [Cupriavidus sp. 8B]
MSGWCRSRSDRAETVRSLDPDLIQFSEDRDIAWGRCALTDQVVAPGNREIEGRGKGNVTPRNLENWRFYTTVADYCRLHRAVAGRPLQRTLIVPAQIVNNQKFNVCRCCLRPNADYP